jgi:hypothetical protein
MAIYDHPVRSDHEVRALLQLLTAANGTCADPVLRLELLDTGFVRPGASETERLHLTPTGRAFLTRTDPATRVPEPRNLRELAGPCGVADTPCRSLLAPSVLCPKSQMPLSISRSSRRVGR